MESTAGKTNAFHNLASAEFKHPLKENITSSFRPCLLLGICNGSITIKPRYLVPKSPVRPSQQDPWLKVLHWLLVQGLQGLAAIGAINPLDTCIDREEQAPSNVSVLSIWASGCAFNMCVCLCSCVSSATMPGIPGFSGRVYFLSERYPSCQSRPLGFPKALAPWLSSSSLLLSCFCAIAAI